MWSETCFSIAQTAGLAFGCARCAVIFSVVRTVSTSYAERASSMERGRPDQITLSGSTGGMKSVDFSVAMS
jgi:hypothetical protein